MRALTGSQFELYAYVCALLGGTESARDVLQETNVDLWNKASTYDPRRPFLPWARAIAFYQVLTHRRKAARSRLVFDDDLLRDLSARFCAQGERLDRELEALGGCVERLTGEQQQLVRARYHDGVSVNDIAARLRRGANVVAASLYRIRRALMACVQQSLAAGEPE
jgi:RNA polymerase sigma-70 factor (ECF subfamily)